MADQLSNPAGRMEPSGGAHIGVKRKAGGSQKRPGNPITGPARGKAATVSGTGTEDRNRPESGRARQDAANGTVHGQPRSGYKGFDNIDR